MTGARRRRGQRIRIDYGPLVTASGALRFGRSGGCAAGCELCLYHPICAGGEIGEQEESEIGEQEHDVQQFDEVQR